MQYVLLIVERILEEVHVYDVLHLVKEFHIVLDHDLIVLDVQVSEVLILVLNPRDVFNPNGYIYIIYTYFNPDPGPACYHSQPSNLGT